jgi:hypothetical protein
LRVDETSLAVYSAAAVLGVDEFVFRPVGEEFIIHVRHTSSALTSEQLTDARRVAFALRYGIETNDPSTVALARQLEHALSNPSSSFNPLLEPSSSSLFENWLSERLRQELELGRLLVERIPQVSLSERREKPPEALPPRPPQRETSDTFFEVRLVDEIGQAISGAPVELACDGEIHDLSTNAAGVALLEHVTASSAAASVSDPVPVQEALDPRWTKRRAGKPPKVRRRRLAAAFPRAVPVRRSRQSKSVRPSPACVRIQGSARRTRAWPAAPHRAVPASIRPRGFAA